MKNKWTIYKNISKIISYFFIIICLWQAYIIMNGYYQRNKDSPTFWSLKEVYNYKSYTNEIPKELIERKAEFDLFQFECLGLFFLCILVEIFRYKENPGKWKEKIEKDKLLNWFRNKFAPKLNKLFDIKKEDKNGNFKI